MFYLRVYVAIEMWLCLKLLFVVFCSLSESSFYCTEKTIEKSVKKMQFRTQYICEKISLNCKKWIHEDSGQQNILCLYCSAYGCWCAATRKHLQRKIQRLTMNRSSTWICYQKYRTRVNHTELYKNGWLQTGKKK